MIGLAEACALEAAVMKVVGALEPDAVPLPDAVPVWDVFDAIERCAAAAKTLLARRVEASRVWERGGHRSAAEFMAHRAGTSVATARTQLDVSRTVEEVPILADALRRGGLSGAKAALIAEGSAARPDAAAQLLEQAERSSLKELRDEVLRVREAADPDPNATQRRIHTRRHLRTWRDAEGAWNLAARGTVTDGVRIEAALKPLIDNAFANARAEERHEPREAYAFDALVTLAEGGGDTKKPTLRNMTVLRIDVAALHRGAVHDGETCEIAGIGPVPVSTARKLLGESVLELVVTKGVDVMNVTHLGRGPSAAQKIAMLWTSPICTAEGCTRTRLEHDHGEPWAQNPQTRVENLRSLCDHHHDLKTRHGWDLVDGTGRRPMVPPDDPRHPKNRPKEDTS